MRHPFRRDLVDGEPPLPFLAIELYLGTLSREGFVFQVNLILSHLTFFLCTAGRQRVCVSLLGVRPESAIVYSFSFLDKRVKCFVQK